MRSIGLLGVSFIFVAAAACGGGTGTAGEPVEAKDSGSGFDDDSGVTIKDSAAPIDDSAVDPADSGSTTIDDGPGIPSDGMPTETLRFVAMGDTGEGNDGQTKVAAAIAAKCAKDGCDFVQLLGDNIYNTGVSSTTDPEWTAKFVTPYGAISLPFYAVLGNHDYGADGLGTDWGKAQNEVDYTKVSTKWKMPARYWFRGEKGVDMFALDTNAVMTGLWGSRVNEQKTALAGWLGSSKSTWKIAFGHHPYLSNGKHGNAGNYDNIFSWLPGSGKSVKEFLEDEVCGKVDLYLAGHDHSRQWLNGTCKGTELIVTGAGAKVTELKGSNPNHWQANTIGFTYVVIQGNKLTAEMVDGDGKVEFSRTLTK